MEFWIRISPHGCVTGSSIGDAADNPGEAHREFTSDRSERAEETRKGWRHELVDDDTWDRIAKPCLRGVCAHRTGRKEKQDLGRRRQDEPSCPVCGHDIEVHDAGRPCGERWDVCNHPHCAEFRMERWLRREQLQILLSRMERGVLLPEERKLLRATVMAEVSDVERAYALVAKMRSGK